MNKIIAFVLLISFNSYSQIKTIKITPKENFEMSKPYDSLSNFLGDDYAKYVGQNLYLKGKHRELREFGYEGFYTTDKKRELQESIYKCCSGYNSKYEELAENYFTVLEVNNQNADNEVFFKLKEQKSGDVIYYLYDPKYDWSFPFIVVGFFEKMKNKYVGEEFVFGNTDLRFGKEQLDIKTGKTIEFELGEKWKCVDVVIDEEYYKLSFLFKDDDNQNLIMNYEMIVGENKMYDVFPFKESEKYKKKFGEQIWKTILEGNVKIGMTREMCKLSWGDPIDVNKTVTANKKTEQWVYGNNYLYFENDKVIAIQ